MEITREIKHDSQGQPLMILRRKRGGPGSFAVRFKDLWMFSEKHNPLFERNMKITCEQVFNLFDLGEPTPRKMAQLAWLIEDGIDEMIKLPPPPISREQVGEGTVTVGSQKHNIKIHNDWPAEVAGWA